jgi:hypothetical protein
MRGKTSAPKATDRLDLSFSHRPGRLTSVGNGISRRIGDGFVVAIETEGDNVAGSTCPSDQETISFSARIPRG